MEVLNPLDHALNDAILDVVARVLPHGFDVSDDAPQTFEGLYALISSGRRLVVWSGASRSTIYADPEVNYAFRAWHDWTHWVTNHPFTPDGEAQVCISQCRQLIADFRADPRAHWWCKILEAEIIGQNTFARMHKRFPDDQIGFVSAYLHDPRSALLWSLW